MANHSRARITRTAHRHGLTIESLDYEHGSRDLSSNGWLLIARTPDGRRVSFDGYNAEEVQAAIMVNAGIPVTDPTPRTQPESQEDE